MMFEENPPSSYLTRVAHSEGSQETVTAISQALRDQENTRPIPVDDSESSAAPGVSPANPISPQHRLAKLRLLPSRQKAEYKSKLASRERRNRELRWEMQDMRSQLGQRHRLAEGKIRNAERAMEEMKCCKKEFFETFGVINR